MFCLGINCKGTARFTLPVQKAIPLYFVMTVSISMDVFSPQISTEYLWALVASSHSSWQSVIGLSTMGFFSSLVSSDSSLSHAGTTSTSKKAKSTSCCFCSQCTCPEVCRIFSSLYLLSHVLSERHILSNLIHRSSRHRYNKQAYSSLCEDQTARQVRPFCFYQKPVMEAAATSSLIWWRRSCNKYRLFNCK